MTQNNNSQTFMQNNKNLLIAAGAIIIVIILAIMLPRMTSAPVEAPVEEETTIVETENETTASPRSTSYPAGEAAYLAAIEANEGKTITFSGSCVADPKTTTVKAGEHALLVNATDEPHTFTVGTDSYTVGERHYKTLRIKTPGTYSISCDDQKDLASVTVE
ncbi:MAG TPA: hypothetical protein VGE18_00270 [Candidatus Paceibacterota bacterium]